MERMLGNDMFLLSFFSSPLLAGCSSRIQDSHLWLAKLLFCTYLYLCTCVEWNDQSILVFPCCQPTFERMDREGVVWSEKVTDWGAVLFWPVFAMCSMYWKIILHQFCQGGSAKITFLCEDLCKVLHILEHRVRLIGTIQDKVTFKRDLHKTVFRYVF